MGSVSGTIKDAIDEMRDGGHPIGLVTLVSFRPFPIEALRQALAGAQACRRGRKEPRRRHGRAARQQCRCRAAQLPTRPRMHSAIAGLGGRADHRGSLHRLFRQALVQPWEGPHFLDLNERVVGREMHRCGKARRSGPTAENILKITRARTRRQRSGQRERTP